MAKKNKKNTENLSLSPLLIFHYLDFSKKKKKKGQISLLRATCPDKGKGIWGASMTG